ncbi:hypothetical protein [Ekhidna lutea]|nr:hypothetical protein [Ekhidna lutea]
MAQKPGIVTDSIICKHDKSQTYAVYLPSNYTEDKKWPIVYFFEPAARGKVPVQLYAEVAEELGYILACTNNSRNGSYDNSFKAADAIFVDTESRFSIDNSRIILSGFSGGSRLALSIAVITKAAYGVIGVGAAQPTVPHYMVLDRKNFKYAGLVGARDMNYLEHKTFQSLLNALSMDNLLLVSNLKHNWATPSDFRIALLWMQMVERPNDPGKFYEALYSKITVEKDSIPLSDLIYMDELTMEKPLINEKDKNTKKLLREESKIINKEQGMVKAIQDSIASAFNLNSSNNRSLNWLLKKVGQIKNLKEKSSSLYEIMMYDRVLNYMSAACYETGLSMKARGLIKQALIGIAIWEAVTENRVYANWLKARVYAQDKNTTLAIQHLEAALQSGKIQKTTIFRESDFIHLHEQQLFKDLIESYYN